MRTCDELPIYGRGGLIKGEFDDAPEFLSASLSIVYNETSLILILSSCQPSLPSIHQIDPCWRVLISILLKRVYIIGVLVTNSVND
jgi:hypothetical protein